MAPPVFALLAWNLGVYLVLAGGFITHYGDTNNPGPVRRLVLRVASRTGMGNGGGGSTRGDAGEIIGASIAALTADWLIGIHGLEGRAAGEVLARLASDVRTGSPMDEGKAAVMGGVVTGALSGLAADLAAGGALRSRPR